MRKWVFLLLLVAGVGAGSFVWRARGRDAPPPPPASVPVANDTFALLVGCTEYPELEKVSDPAIYASNIRLLGPENDVSLLHSVLRRYLGVPEANIRVLAGWPADAEARPTRDNILGHLDHLAGQVSPGSRVLFLFAGHGGQQPDADGGEEMDRYDEILLPADAGQWDAEIGGAARVIRDDEIGGRLLALRDAGATVWAIFDCCHSGTMMRGPGAGTADDAGLGEVRLRSLPPNLLGIPTASGAVSARGGGGENTGGILPTRGRSLEGIASISAARSWEKAPEMVLPRRRLAAGREHHGLLTFEVARTLQHYGGSLTIAEVFDRVRSAYAALPWGDATPVAEGDLTLRVLPGRGDGGPALILRRDGDALVLDAGSLRFLTVGSVLEVYEPGGFLDPEALLGRLKLTEVEPLRSRCAAVPGGPDPSDIPAGAPARIVKVAPGGMPLRLALVDPLGRSVSVRRVAPIAGRVFRDGATRALYPFVGPKQADWVVREVPTGPDGVTRFVLAPANAQRGIEPLEVEADELADVLDRVRRAESRRRYASAGPLGRLPDGLVVEARLLRFGAEAEEELGPETDLVPGDHVLLRITNGSEHDVDVAVSNLDAAQRESPVWPESEPSRRLTRYEKEAQPVDPLTLSDDGFGRESVLLFFALRDGGAAALDVGRISGVRESKQDDIVGQHGTQALESTLMPEGVTARDGEATSMSVTEIAWNTTWGDLVLAPSLRARMTALEPPIDGVALPPRDADPAADDVVWHRALVLSGDPDHLPENPGWADVLVLSGAAGAEEEGPIAVLIDEDGDARLGEADLAATVRRVAEGSLPVELMIVFHGDESWAAYPGEAVDAGFASVRVRAGDSDRAERRLDRGADGWDVRETCGPWLSTALAPVRGRERGRQRYRMVQAIRQVFHHP